MFTAWASCREPGAGARTCEGYPVCSKTRFNTDRLKQFEVMRDTLSAVLEKLPQRLHDNPDVKALRGVSARGKVSLVHVINRHTLRTSNSRTVSSRAQRVTISGMRVYPTSSGH